MSYSRKRDRNIAPEHQKVISAHTNLPRNRSEISYTIYLVGLHGFAVCSWVSQVSFILGKIPPHCFGVDVLEGLGHAGRDYVPISFPFMHKIFKQIIVEDSIEQTRRIRIVHQSESWLYS